MNKSRIIRGFGWSALVGLLGLFGPQLSRGQVKLNEVMAENRTVLENGDDFPDYIELLNLSLQEVSLAGMSLSDDIAVPRKFTFPPGTTLAAGAYLLIFADSETNSPGMHTGFGLADGGDRLTLYASASEITVLDAVTFGLQLPDRSIGRIPNGSETWTLNRPTPLAANEAQPLAGPEQLALNEWMAMTTKPGGSLDDDWLEVYNGTNLPVHLGGIRLSDSSINHPIPALTFIDALGFIQFIADDDAAKGADHLPFKLSSTSGETLTIYNTDGVSILNRVTFGPQTNNISHGRLPDGAAPPYEYFQVGRDTPAASNFLIVTNVVFNELISHTDPPLEDAVELYNPTATEVDISRWWMSDDRNDPKRYRIPANTVIPPGGYVVFYEVQFNSNFSGVPPRFSFNSYEGEEINLFSADAAGNLTGSRLREAFAASQNGVSFGRYIRSDGEKDFVAMSARSFGNDNPLNQGQFRQGTGRTNPAPRVGPVVINEVMYHPPNIIVGTNSTDNSLDEYIELKNITGGTINLFDPLVPTNTWRVRQAVAFELPTGVTLSGGATLLLVNFDPVAEPGQLAIFRNKYGIGAGVGIYGPYRGKLSNSGDSIELFKPDPPQTTPPVGFVPYIQVDRLNYKENAPWPVAADGTGNALQRIAPEAYGNDPINWTAASPTPGRESLNLSAEPVGNDLVLRFRALIGSSYAVQVRDNAGSGEWYVLQAFPPQSSSGILTATDSNLRLFPSRFFRLVSPAP